MTPFTVARQEAYKNLSAFAEIKAPLDIRALMERCFDVLRGRVDANNFRQIVQKDLRGRGFFVNDNCWWLYTDSQCNCFGTYGWRPFFDAALRLTDYHTWHQFFAHQSDGKRKEPGSTRTVPRGAFPFSVNPGSKLDPQPWVTYYSNYFRDDPQTHHPDHDELVDFQLLNLITATDWLLFEQAADTAKKVLPQIELFIEYLDGRPKRGELLLVGVQGSQVEFGHGTKRYPASTAFYLLTFYRNLSEVYRLVQREQKAEAIEDRTFRLNKQIKDFIVEGGWFAGARTEDYQYFLGNGQVDGSSLATGMSDYFEAFPNTAPALFGWFDQKRCRTITNRILEIPQLYQHHLMVYNYPARPASEMDDNAAFPPPGGHVNGGWWWMTAGTAMALFARSGHPEGFRLVAEVFEDHDARYTIDYYNEWGANKDKQWLDKRRSDMCSVTNLGAFGNFLRALLGIHIRHDELELSPMLPPEVERLRLKVPIHVGGREVYLDIRNTGAGTIRGATVDGRALEIDDSMKVRLRFEEMGKQLLLQIDM